MLMQISEKHVTPPVTATRADVPLVGVNVSTMRVVYGAVSRATTMASVVAI